MRCHYLSDLHLESQEFRWQLPKGDVLIVAGDLCHARCLDPARPDKYSIDQRKRVMCFREAAVASFKHVLLIAGNHDHYDGVFEDTTASLARHLPGMTVLDNTAVEIDGVSFFGTTLWSDFEGRSAASLNAVRRRLGEFFFVKMRTHDSDGQGRLANFGPRMRCRGSMPRSLPSSGTYPPKEARKRSLSHITRPVSKGSISCMPATVSTAPMPATSMMSSARCRFPSGYGHTHIRRTYRIGDTIVHANCQGFDGKDASAKTFTPGAYFDV